MKLNQEVEILNESGILLKNLSSGTIQGNLSKVLTEAIHRKVNIIPVSNTVTRFALATVPTFSVIESVVKKILRGESTLGEIYKEYNSGDLNLFVDVNYFVENKHTKQEWANSLFDNLEYNLSPDMVNYFTDYIAVVAGMVEFEHIYKLVESPLVKIFNSIPLATASVLNEAPERKATAVETLFTGVDYNTYTSDQLDFKLIRHLYEPPYKQLAENVKVNMKFPKDYQLTVEEIDSIIEFKTLTESIKDGQGKKNLKNKLPSVNTTCNAVLMALEDVRRLPTTRALKKWTDSFIESFGMLKNNIGKISTLNESYRFINSTKYEKVQMNTGYLIENSSLPNVTKQAYGKRCHTVGKFINPALRSQVLAAGYRLDDDTQERFKRILSANRESIAKGLILQMITEREKQLDIVEVLQKNAEPVSSFIQNLNISEERCKLYKMKAKALRDVEWSDLLM